jgi:hypothetical protein
LPFLDAELKARPVTKSCLRREVDGRSGGELGVDIVSQAFYLRVCRWAPGDSNPEPAD